MKPKVQVFALGGTIAMAPRQDGGGVGPGLDADDLVGAVAAWSGDVDLVAESLFSLPSSSLAFA